MWINWLGDGVTIGALLSYWNRGIPFRVALAGPLGGNPYSTSTSTSSAGDSCADPALRDYALYSLGGTYTLTGRLTLGGEVYGETDHHDDLGAFDHHHVTPLAGLIGQLSARVVLDAALLLGLDGSTGTEYGSTLGVSLSF